MRIVILAGGNSPEREVSLISGKCVREALSGRRHRVDCFDPAGGPLPKELLARADAVFLALHGGEGEDGTLQKELEQAGIYHYTGSSPEASALAMCKDRAKAAVSAAGIPVAEGGVLQAGEKPFFAGEMVFKPLNGGSSVGLLILHSPSELPDVPFSEPMLFEKLLPGREYSVGLLGNATLPAVEIRPKGGIYDYAHKYTHGATEELCPAPISAQKSAWLREKALHAASVLGLRDLARVDFKEDGAGIPCFLEANTLPGMTGESLLPLAAKTAGVPFGELCETIALLAAARKNSGK